MIAFALAAGFLPVVLLLAGQVAMDCYQLVPRRRVIESIVWGAIAGGISWGVHTLARDRLGRARLSAL